MTKLTHVGTAVSPKQKDEQPDQSETSFPEESDINNLYIELHYLSDFYFYRLGNSHYTDTNNEHNNNHDNNNK